MAKRTLSDCWRSNGHTAKKAKLNERQSLSADSNKIGLLDLPAELRNQIYQHVLVDDEKLDFGHPTNLQHTAAILRTCRQVHDEARGILYSENVFCLRRRKEQTLRTRWSSDTFEIGYEDIAFFLESIGARNIEFLRHVILGFEDAVPAMNLHLATANDRRFTNDDDLMTALDLLRQHGRIQTLELVSSQNTLQSLMIH